VKRRHHAKLVHEGKYAAEVDVELVETDEGWSPYLSLEDAYKLDTVREALPLSLTKPSKVWSGKGIYSFWAGWNSTMSSNSRALASFREIWSSLGSSKDPRPPGRGFLKSTVAALAVSSSLRETGCIV